MIGWRCWLKDRFWPSLDGPTGQPESVPGEFFPIQQTGNAADEILAEIERAETSENNREKTADQKLQAMLQFASVAVTVLLTVAALFLEQKYRFLTPIAVTVILCTAAYVSLQCLRAALAAIRGLERRSFKRPNLDQLGWQGGDDLHAYQHRVAIIRAHCLAQNRETVNEKVSWMAVGHVALKNALVVLMTAIYLLTVISVYQAWSDHRPGRLNKARALEAEWFEQ